MNNDRPIGFETVRSFFSSGELWRKNPQELNHCLRGMAIESEENEGIRHQYLIIASVIQSILLGRILDEQEKRNKKLTNIVIILTIIYTTISLVQLVVSVCR